MLFEPDLCGFSPRTHDLNINHPIFLSNTRLSDPVGDETHSVDCREETAKTGAMKCSFSYFRQDFRISSHVKAIHWIDQNNKGDPNTHKAAEN